MRPAMTVTVMMMAMIATACAALQSAPAERPECSDRALLELESRYVAEIMVVCDGHAFDACGAREAIDARFDALREEWVACQ